MEDLNHCDIKQEHIELLKCCGSRQWTEKMLATRPYKSVSHLLELAGQIWSDLGEVDYLEAFAAHPKIGASKPPDNAKNTESWTSKEQAGMMSADEQTKLKLKTENQKYAEKFGYIFIACATGKRIGNAGTAPDSAGELPGNRTRDCSWRTNENYKFAA